MVMGLLFRVVRVMMRRGMWRCRVTGVGAFGVALRWGGVLLESWLS